MVNQNDTHSAPADLLDERPWTLTLAVRLLVTMIVLGGVTLILLIVRQDDLIRVWAEGNPAVRDVLESRGLDAVKDGSVPPPRFIPVGITIYIVVAGLVAMLTIFLRNGFEWARVGVTAALFFATVAGFAGFRVGQPTLFTVCTAVLMVLVVALMVPLWHPATTAYIHESPDDSYDAPTRRS